MWCFKVTALALFALIVERTESYQCTHGSYPPTNERVERFVVDLDLPPSERWREVVTKKAPQIQAILTGLRNIFGFRRFGDYLLRLVNGYMGPFVRTLPAPYAEEIASVAKFANITVEEATLFNEFYEFFTVCTSIVAENDDGTMIHGRNLDFGFLLGWNNELNTWGMTEILRKTAVELEWKRGNRTLFYSVNFAGYVGILTALKPGAFSLTINERFNMNGGYIGLMQWLLGQRDIAFAGYMAREVMENNATYSDAVRALTNVKLIAPVYFIVGGTQSGEGIVLTKDRNVRTAANFSMQSNNLKYGQDWFVLATNYDLDDTPPSFDDRVSPGIDCMTRLGKSKVGFEGLFNVLSTDPNLNQLTVYTTLMNIKTGDMETYIQKCYTCSLW